MTVGLVVFLFKGIVDSQMNVLSLFTHPHVVPNFYAISFFCDTHTEIKIF